MEGLFTLCSIPASTSGQNASLELSFSFVALCRPGSVQRREKSILEAFEYYHFDHPALPLPLLFITLFSGSCMRENFLGLFKY